MRTVWAAAFLLRRLRVELGVVLLIVALVGITSFLFAAAPRLFNLVADDGLRVAVAEAPPAAANIELSRQFVAPAFDDPLAVVDRQGETFLARFPASVSTLVRDRAVVTTSPRFAVSDPPQYATFVSLRHEDPLGDAVDLVDGRLPQSTGEQLPSVALADRPVARVEVAFSDVTAETIGVAVGDVLQGSLDDTDPLVGRSIGDPLLVELEVVGIIRIVDPAAERWYADVRLQEPSIRGSVDDPIAFATGLISPDAVADVVASELPFRYEWRYFIDGERVDAGQLDTLVRDLRRAASEYSTVTTGSRTGQWTAEPSSPAADRIVLRTGLLAVIEDYEAERAASEAVLSIAAIGPVALAAGAIAMSAVLVVARRRQNLVLARDRGASRAVILGAQLWEAALIAGAAALLGLLLAVLVVPGRASPLSGALALATALGAIVVLVAATFPVIRRGPEHAGRDEAPPVRTSPRRFVLELTAVGIALGGVVLLQQRGLRVGGQGESAVRFDPFLAAVPMLTGLAAAILATRLYPLPIRLLGWLAARRRDLVPVLGLRNVGRRPSFATLPLLILMLTAAFGSFASVVLASIDRGQVDASWSGVGADYRVEVEDGSLVGFEPGGVTGAEATAPGYANPLAIFESSPNQRARIRFEAVNPTAWTQVTSGTPAATAWPAAFLRGGSPPAGTEEDPIPAIVSRRLPAGSSALTAGEEFPVIINDRTLQFEVVEVRARFPGVGAGTPFVIAPYRPVEAAITAADAPRRFEPNVLLVRGGPDLGGALEAAVDEGAPSAVVTSRHAWYAALRDAPLIAVVGGGFRVALLVAGAYAALAVLAALTLTSSRRTQDLAFLRTLGLSGGQATGVTIVEHGIPVVVALVPGVLTGIAIARLLEGSLGLGAFIGPEAAFQIHVDWPGLALVGVALIGVVALAIAASTWLARRARTVDALRVGEA